MCMFWSQMTIRLTQQTQNICITFVGRRPNDFDVGPTLWKYYTNVLCLLGIDPFIIMSVWNLKNILTPYPPTQLFLRILFHPKSWIADAISKSAWIKIARFYEMPSTSVRSTLINEGPESPSFHERTYIYVITSWINFDANDMSCGA